MTRESRQPEGAGSQHDVVRSAALTSADLWREILERLDEVQEGQLRLARAIESLGMIVFDALSSSPKAALANDETAALTSASARAGRAAGALPPAPVDARDPEAQRTIDQLLDRQVFAPATTPPPGRRPTPSTVRAGAAGSPRFFVPPAAEEPASATPPATKEPPPRGRAVARGLGRETPTITKPAVVPDLTPAAVDALLAAEFGGAPPAASTPPVPVTPAADGGPLLSNLLGTAFRASAPAPRPSTPTAEARPVAPTVTPRSSPAGPALAPPTIRPGRTPVAPAPVAGPPPSPPSPPVTVPSVAPPPPQGPPPPAEVPPPVRPASTPVAPAAPPAPAAAAAAARPPAGPGPLPPPPAPTSAPPPPAAGAPGAETIPSPAIPPRPPVVPRSDDPAPFVPPGGAVSPPPPPPFGTDVSTGDHDDQLVTTGKPAHSVASMATEILSAAPRTQAPEPAEPAPTMLAEDVTIMARSRRRRFRLR